MSLLIPFRSQSQTPLLPNGYGLSSDPAPTAQEVYRLQATGEQPPDEARWQLALGRSTWHLGVRRPDQRLVGFVRATSDLALNANLWNLVADPDDPHQELLLQVLVQTALTRLRRDLPGCSISLSAPPDTLTVLRRCGFVIDPGGIRAMGRWIGPTA